MKKLHEVIIGSRMHGLDHPKSDVDKRIIFITENVNEIVGLDKCENLTTKEETVEEISYELRHFIYQLRKSNPQAIEMIFTSMAKYTLPLFHELIIRNRYSLVDSEKLYKVISNYLPDELIKTTSYSDDIKAESPRKQLIDKYGYVPKRIVNIIRLAYTVNLFLKSGEYIVNVRDISSMLANELLDIKLHPENHKIDDLYAKINSYKDTLHISFKELTDMNKCTFDNELANNILFEFYFPIMCEKYHKKQFEQL
jgi:predicted nucleotidyltransferase